MKKQKADAPGLTQAEIRLIGQLREHPQMMVRVQSLLEIARNAEGPLKTASTPGAFFAAAVSMPLMSAWACGERSTWARAAGAESFVSSV